MSNPLNRVMLCGGPSVLADLKLPKHGYILAVGGRSQRKNLMLIERALAGFEGCPPLGSAGGAPT